MKERNQNYFFKFLFLFALVISVFFIGKSFFQNISTERSTQSYFESERKGVKKSSVYVWGSNSHGQLSFDNRSVYNLNNPTALSQDTFYERVVAGWNHTVGLDKDGNVFTWGFNNKGQLGREVVAPGYSYKKEIVEGLQDIVGLDAKLHHTVAVDARGDVWAFGSNYNAQLGDGTNQDSYTPIKVEGLPEIEEVAAGYRFSMAIDKQKGVWIWGAMCNEDNQREFEDILASIADNMTLLGGYFDLNGDSFVSRDPETDCMNENVVGIRTRSPKKVEGVDMITETSGGYGHVLMLDKDHKVYSFGCNAFGQLGWGNDLNTPENVHVQKVLLEDVVQISAGFRHSLALLKDGSVWSWGHNKRGELGLGDFEGRNSPHQISFPGGIKFKKIVAGHDNSLAVDVEGNLWAWGDTQNKILFDGPDSVPAPLSKGVYLATPTKIRSIPVKSVTLGGTFGVILTE